MTRQEIDEKKPKMGRPCRPKIVQEELTDEQKLLKLNELREYWRDLKKSKKLTDEEKLTKDLTKIKNIKALNNNKPVPKRKYQKLATNNLMIADIFA